MSKTIMMYMRIMSMKMMMIMLDGDNNHEYVDDDSIDDVHENGDDHEREPNTKIR